MFFVAANSCMHNIIIHTRARALVCVCVCVCTCLRVRVATHPPPFPFHTPHEKVLKSGKCVRFRTNFFTFRLVFYPHHIRIVANDLYNLLTSMHVNQRRLKWVGSSNLSSS
jgi:hypothetical protein